MRVGCVAERAPDDKLTVVSTVMAGLVPAIYVNSAMTIWPSIWPPTLRFGYG
jgi:hypothetical protein